MGTSQPGKRGAVSDPRPNTRGGSHGKQPDRQLDRFTNQARHAILIAGEEAARFNHEYIGTEHILLGLIQEGSGVAANVLKNLYIDLDKIRREVEKIVRSGPSMVTMGQLPFTPRAKKVLDLAVEEAGNMGHDCIGAGHLLLGLIRENEGAAGVILVRLGANIDAGRAAVRSIVAQTQSGASAAAEAKHSVKPKRDPDLVAMAASVAAAPYHYTGDAKTTAASIVDYARAILEEIDRTQS